MHIPMSRPSLSASEIELVTEVFDSGWLGEGEYTERFEKSVAALVQATDMVAVNTGTSALHLSLEALGIGPDDEVILPSFTYAADAMAVRMCGAKPLFCEIDPMTLNLDPDHMASLTGNRCRAIMPTDYAGLPCDIGIIRKRIGARDIKIIRDASHSFGSRINGKIVGAWNGEDITCFSFDPIKNLTCGEGGGIVVNSPELAAKLRIMKRLGFERSPWTSFSGNTVTENQVTQTGFRYHLSNINAAIGLAQLKRFGEIIENKQRLAKTYHVLLDKHPMIHLFERDYDQIVPFMFVIRVEAKHRDKLIRYLNSRGIHAGLRYTPCHLHPLFRNDRISLPVTEKICQEILSLPLYPDMSSDNIKEVVDATKSYFK